MPTPNTPHEAQALERDAMRMREALEEFASLLHTNRKPIAPKRVTDYDEDAGVASIVPPAPMMPSFEPTSASIPEEDELFFVDLPSTRPATDTVMSADQPTMTFPVSGASGASADESAPVPPPSGDSIDDAFNGFQWA